MSSDFSDFGPDSRHSLRNERGANDDFDILLDPDPALTPPEFANLDPDATAVFSDSSKPTISFGFSKRFGVLLGKIKNDSAEVFYHGRLTAVTLAEVQRCVGRPLNLQRIDEADFRQRLQESTNDAQSQAQQVMEGFESEGDLLAVAQQLPEPSDLLESDDDAPVIRLINAVLTQAVRENASDIHIEPYENQLVVRFRVDGVLREVISTPQAIAPLLVSRVKVMAKLDIAEKRLPQDGRIGIRIAGRAVDCRVSTLPSGHGERVVIRLLDKQAGRLNLEHLGMAKDQQTQFDELIHRPHGIILVTGPTGSGKTTTLYAGLGRIHDESRNIMTVEDPIEYHIEGIGQTQVNPKVDMTFARGLRAILRQDPDVVMVGEIRDLETAEIAVQASLTGHLVLSTLHTNTAVGAVTRLRDMGVEPFLLSSSLIGVLAQRLVRVLCDACKKDDAPTPSEAQRLGLITHQHVTIQRAGGCEQCQNTGYRGRTGIYELISVDGPMRTMIHDGASEQELEQHARQLGPSILEDAAKKVLAGITTIEEVLRVTQER